MTETTTLRDRVARRTAANAARQTAKSAKVTVPETLDVSVESAESTPEPETETPVQQIARRSIGLLPDVDLTREIDARDLVMPKLRISQAMSEVFREHMRSKGASGVPGGNWYHSTSGKSLGEVMYFIPCDMRKSRAMFVQGQGLLCRSFDMIQGEGDPGILCEGTYEERQMLPEKDRGCPLRHWVRDREANTATPPKCGVTYNYTGIVVLDPDDPSSSKTMTGLLQMRSAATPAAKKLNTLVMDQVEGKWTGAVFAIGTYESTNNKGTYWIPTVEVFDLTDGEEYARIRKLAEKLGMSMSTQRLRVSVEADDLE